MGWWWRRPLSSKAALACRLPANSSKTATVRDGVCGVTGQSLVSVREIFWAPVHVRDKDRVITLGPCGSCTTSIIK